MPDGIARPSGQPRQRLPAVLPDPQLSGQPAQRHRDLISSRFCLPLIDELASQNAFDESFTKLDTVPGELGNDVVQERAEDALVRLIAGE